MHHSLLKYIGYIPSKEEIPSNSIFVEFKILSSVPKLVGEIPFDINLKIAPCLLVYAIMTQAIIVIIGIAYVFEMSNRDTMHKLLFLVQNVQCIALLLCLVINSLRILQMRKGLKEMAIKLEKVDSLLTKIGSVNEIKGWRIMKRPIFELILVLVILIHELGYIYKTIKNEKNLMTRVVQHTAATLFYYGAVLKVGLYRSMMTGSLRAVRKRFYVLLDRGNKLEKKNTDIGPDLELLCKAHLVLTETTQVFNKTFGPQLLALTGSCFLVIVVLAYSSTDACLIKKHYIKDLASYLVVNINWIILLAYFIWDVVSTACSTTSTAKEFIRLLEKIVVEGKSATKRALLTNILIRLYITVNEKIRVTALDFYLLDYSLIQSMIGAATTYLVILIQFSPVPSLQAHNTNLSS